MNRMSMCVSLHNKISKIEVKSQSRSTGDDSSTGLTLFYAGNLTNAFLHEEGQKFPLSNF